MHSTIAALLAAHLGLLIATAADDPLSSSKHRQDVVVPAAGMVEVNLPSETLDAARIDLADLRVLDADNQEVPFLIAATPPSRENSVPAKSFQATLVAGSTQLVIEAPDTASLVGVTLTSPAPQFLKSVAVEASPDGQAWNPLVQGRPVFRQSTADNLRVSFPAAEARFLRLTIDDKRTPAIPFTGATVRVAAPPQPPSDPVPVTITERAEMPGRTRLAIDLGAAHLPLASLEIETADPLFMRHVSVQASVIAADTGDAHEVMLAGGTIYRVAVEGAPPQSQLGLSVGLLAPVRGLVLLIDNDDSPPLEISGVRATRRPVPVQFLARSAGTFALVCGNPQATAPRYDVAALETALKGAAVAKIAAGPLTANTRYLPPTAPAEVPALAAPLDVAKWAWHKIVQIAKPGIQQVELDPDVLARAKSGGADLRLMNRDRQVPYLLERTSLLRVITPAATPAPDPKRPRTGRWEILLPVAGLPAIQLTCTTRTPLFERQAELFEDAKDTYGQTIHRRLGAATWKRSAPSDRPPTLTLPLGSLPVTDRWFLEIDNGDNAPVQLESFAVSHPAVRLIFKSDTSAPLDLIYGNRDAAAPHYDLALGAALLLNSDKSPATLGPEEPLSASSGPHPIAGKSGIIFWSILALVVIVLLVLIARLLPKPKGS